MYVTVTTILNNFRPTFMYGLPTYIYPWSDLLGLALGHFYQHTTTELYFARHLKWASEAGRSRTASVNRRQAARGATTSVNTTINLDDSSEVVAKTASINAFCLPR